MITKVVEFCSRPLFQSLTFLTWRGCGNSTFAMYISREEINSVLHKIEFNILQSVIAAAAETFKIFFIEFLVPKFISRLAAWGLLDFCGTKFDDVMYIYERYRRIRWNGRDDDDLFLFLFN